MKKNGTKAKYAALVPLLLRNFFLLFLKQMWYELVESATPGEELMACALRDRGIDLDAELTEGIDDGLALDEVVGTPVHIQIMHLLVERVGIGKDTIVGGLHVKAEDGTAESADPSELIQIGKSHIEGLMTTS